MKIAGWTPLYAGDRRDAALYALNHSLPLEEAGVLLRDLGQEGLF